MATHLLLTDPGEIRMFQQQYLIHIAGVRVGREFLDKAAKSKNYTNGLESLLNDSKEKKSIVDAYGKLHVNDHYRAFKRDPQSTPVPKFVEKADVICLKYLMQASPTLRACANIPSQHYNWWKNDSANNVIDKVAQNDAELIGKPGSALLGLYHIRNKIAHPPDAGQFALDDHYFQKWSKTTKKAIQVLSVAVYGETEGENKANELINEALHIANEKSYEEFHKIQPNFVVEKLIESDVIKAVLKDAAVKQHYMDNVDVNLLSIHLAGGSILDFGDELEPLQTLPGVTNRKNKLFDLLLTKLNTFDKFRFFCTKLIDINQEYLADIFQKRFEEELEGTLD